MKFDGVEFYPNISKQFLIDSIEFAKKNIDISNDQIEIILHSCKTILFFNDECLIKSSTQDLFDVQWGATMELRFVIWSVNISYTT